jgi:hypothetical protein
MYDPEILRVVLEDNMPGYTFRWYGKYEGRGGRKGYAIVIEDYSDLLAVGAVLQEDGGYPELLKGFCDNDSLGQKILMCWHHSYFIKEEND